MSYNGWSNYETWVVNLWLSNEEYTYKHWNHMAEMHFAQMKEDDVSTASENSRDNLAEALSDSFTNNEYIDNMGGMYLDLLNSALQEVDWEEIADHLLDEVEGYERKGI